MAFLKRTAPHMFKHLIPAVATKAQAAAIIDKAYRQMLQIVRSEGGFGQHAIVVTSDSRYLGEVPFASW